jgi:hypothetical protein
LFADCDKEGDYDDFGPYACAETTPGLGGNSRDEIIEEITLEEGIEIKTLFPSSPSLAVTFIPPDPEVKIAGGGENLAVITLCLKDDPAITRTITINKAGLID